MKLTPERDWAAKTAMRLHIWQESFVEDDPEVRGAAVWEHLANAFAELGGKDEAFRSLSLKALDQEFPFYTERRYAGKEPTALAEPRAREGPPADNSPQELARALISAAEGMSAEEKEALARQLAEAGIQCAPRPLANGGTSQGSTVVRGSTITQGVPVQFPELEEEFVRLGKTAGSIQSVLGKGHFKPGAAINLIRCLQMLGLLSEQFLQLHPQAWQMWEKIITNHHYTTSFNKPPISPDESLAHFLLGTPTARRADIGLMVAKTFNLAAATVCSVEAAGQEFVSWFFDKFGPERIRSVIQYEAQDTPVGPADYWKRYEQLAEANNGEELAEQFLNLLGRNMLRYIQSKRLG